MTNHHHWLMWPSLVCLFFLTGFPGGREACAQTNNAPLVKRPELKMNTLRWPYEAPNQDKVKLEISGQEIDHVGAAVVITGARISTFAITGGIAQMIAETPECLFEANIQQISSSNLFQAHSGDGNFFVEGTGFVWKQTSPELTLSNNVHTILRQSGLVTGAPNNTNITASQTFVNSHDATFDTKTGVAVYREHVQVIDPRLTLTCALLTAQLLRGGAANQLDHILAETNVMIDFMDASGRKTHATGDRAVYTKTIDVTTNELLELTGHPRLETTNGWATADVFVINQSTGKLEGKGNCHFHTRMNLDPVAGATGKGPAPAETDINSETFDYNPKTGLAVYRDRVRVNSPQIKLVCEKLTANLSGGEAKPSASGNNDIVAEKDVALDYFDAHGAKTHATAEKAVYASIVSNGATHKMLELTGNPVVERADGWIMADLITMDQTSGIIRGEGNHHSIFKTKPGVITTNSPPAVADSEIFSDRFEFKMDTGVAYYRGKARVLDPTMNLECEQLMVKLPQGNHQTRPDHIVAETNVVVDYFKQRGETTHATGQLMNYTFAVTNGNTTNQMLDLTGSPIIDTTSSDPKIGKTHATGDRAIYTSVTTSATTNDQVVLTGHPRVEGPFAIITAEDKIIYDPVTRMIKSMGDTHAVSQPGALSKTNSPGASLTPTEK